MGKKAKHTEEDISLDLSFLKNIFKKKGSKESNRDTSDSAEDISIDFRSARKFVIKYSLLFLILIPIILSVYIRTVPDRLPIADRWARDGIYNNIRQNLANNILSQYPNLDQQSVQKTVDSQFSTVLEQQGPQIEAAIVQQAEGLRQRFKDKDGNYFLGDIDSYYWLRYARNLVETGQYADEIRDGVMIDNRMFAPVGFTVDHNLYPYIEAFLYKFMKIFNSNASLMKAGFYTPLFLSFFAIVAAFLIGKKLAGNLAGLIASILVAVNPTILSRSLGSDNDIVNAVFPLLITLFMLYAFDAKNFRQVLIFTIISGFLIGLYSFAWSGWWFMFLFISLAGAAYIGYIIIYEAVSSNDITKALKNKSLQSTLLLLGIFFVSSFVFLFIFGSHTEFFNAFTAPLKITRLKEAARGINIWPNVYTTVAELNEADISMILSGIGGGVFFWIAMMGILLSIVNLNEKNQTNLPYLALSGLYYMVFIKFFMLGMGLIMMMIWLTLPFIVGILLSIIRRYRINPMHSIMMMVWFMATIYAATKGVRFVLLMVPAFAISFSVFFGILVDFLSSRISKMLELSAVVSKGALVLLSLIILIQPIQSGYATAYGYVPSVNSGWVDSLTKIKTESAPDAIINSWWDFGHWFKFFADRRVTFDGASQNEPPAHWIGKALLTADEAVAISILKMLDCGENKAFRLIDMELNDSYNSVNLLNSVLGKSEDEARQILSSQINDVEEVLASMYCQPPENYFITSGDMVGKSGVWAHFGSWDFQRAKIYITFKNSDFNTFISALTRELNFTEDEAKKTYYELNSFTDDRQFNDWIAPWPGYGGSASCSEKNNALQCNIQMSNSQVIPLQINLSTMEPSIPAGETTYYPNAFGYLDGEEYVVKEYDEDLLGYGIVLLNDKRTILLTSPELVGSMFTRLFYLDGIGLEHFERFDDTVDVGGNRIITWKVKW